MFTGLIDLVADLVTAGPLQDWEAVREEARARNARRFPQSAVS